ncbi:hypothetical protein HDF16_002894 [Granulicella aggregans]|uniref:Uncharacterized protein n=1 Tax=Granulicella aggregans TaxID=474949 RepID=A0A7W7ZE04_9BACT|nr:hypothetical protein [Granulicella aggregans]
MQIPRHIDSRHNFGCPIHDMLLVMGGTFVRSTNRLYIPLTQTLVILSGACRALEGPAFVLAHVLRPPR